MPQGTAAFQGEATPSNAIEPVGWDDREAGTWWPWWNGVSCDFSSPGLSVLIWEMGLHNGCSPPPQDCCGNWKKRDAWVCKLSTRKMVVKQSACGESDGIRVRDTRLHKFSPILKKKKSANTHAEALLHLAEGESYALGVGLLALAG